MLKMNVSTLLRPQFTLASQFSPPDVEPRIPVTADASDTSPPNCGVKPPGKPLAAPANGWWNVKQFGLLVTASKATWSKVEGIVGNRNAGAVSGALDSGIGPHAVTDPQEPLIDSFVEFIWIAAAFFVKREDPPAVKSVSGSRNLRSPSCWRSYRGAYHCTSSLNR